MTASTFQLDIPDMSCQHCEKTIGAAIKSRDPAASLHFDLQARKLEVASELGAESLQHAVESSGYRVTGVSVKEAQGQPHHCDMCD